MENLRIYLSTWNVATSSPTSAIDLNGLLDFPSVTNKHRPLPDFYILGFQEINSQPQNIIKDAFLYDPWTLAITKLLAKNNYVRIKHIRLQGIVLIAFCLRNHLIHLRDIEVQYTRTGFGGMWGNKGAVSIRLTIYGCSMCFVNSHLTPHEHLLEERVKDYNNIVKSHSYHVKDTVNIFYHDYVFWLGDLNFRLSEELSESPEEVCKKIKKVEKDNYSELLKYDQLKSVMTNDLAFSELKEFLIRFPPTYKFAIGSNEYDLKRKPSWTDRILHKVNPNNYENVTLDAVQLNYHSLPQYTISDHKPVVAEFNIKTRVKQNIVIKRDLRRFVFSDNVIEEYVDSVDNVIEEQVVFSYYTERCIEFLPIKDIWYFGDADLLIKFSLSRDVQMNSSDWIGIYEADFENLDDYISYEYLGKINTFIPTTDDSGRIVVFSFPVGSGVRSPGLYRFLYFSQPSSEIRSLLGVSETFEVQSRSGDNLGNLNISSNYDLQTPSTSTDTAQASTSAQTASTIDSLIRDLSNVHVPGLKLNMLNDLSID